MHERQDCYPLQHLTRRNVLAGAITLSCAPNWAIGSSEDELHVFAANTAKNLANGRNVTLRLLLPNGSAANVNPIIDAFKAMTGIQVESKEVNVDDINTELHLRGLSHTYHYDVALPATFGLPDLASTSSIIPITKYARKYATSHCHNSSLYTIGDSFDGEIYGFQTDGDAYLTFYNKRMMQNPGHRTLYEDTYGASLEIPRTWSELDQQIEFFHDPKKGIWGGLLFRTPNYLAWEWWCRFHAKGIWPFSTSMEPQINSDAGLEALEDMIEVTQYLHPDTQRLGIFDNWRRYENDDIYCNIGWGGTQKFLNKPGSKMRGNLLYGPTPGGQFGAEIVPMPYFNWGWNFVVPSGTLEPEIAYLFSLFATSPKLSTLAVRQADGFFDPYRKEHYADEGIRTAYSPEFLTVHSESMKHAIPDLYIKGQAEYFRTLGSWLTRALNREISPQKALDRVAQRWHVISNSNDIKLQQERWRRLRAKYPKRVREILKDLA